jgi:alkylhydroperoxidase family enzyme
MPARIAAVDESTVSEETRRHFKVAEERGAPNSMLLRILANEPNSLNTFYNAWNAIFYEGKHLDHGLKEIVRVRMARLRTCMY